MATLICPPDHTPYPSQQVADNAVQLHHMAFRYCQGFHAWPCGPTDDRHWHIGHTHPRIGDHCKHHPTHRAQAKRLRLANQIGRWR